VWGWLNNNNNDKECGMLQTLLGLGLLLLLLVLVVFYLYNLKQYHALKRMESELLKEKAASENLSQSLKKMEIAFFNKQANRK
jgi:hypothetical protein